MRGPAVNALAVGGVALLAVAVYAAGSRIEVRQRSAAPMAAPEQPSSPIAPRREQPAPPVGGELVFPAARGEGALERVEPRAPLSEPRKEDLSPKPTLLHQPVALAAGRIEAGGHRIEIEGLRVTEPDRRCRNAGGGEWPCGAVARTSFRNWLRGRSVECSVTKEPRPETVAVPCALGKADIGRWLAEQGLAEAVDGGPFAAASEIARAERRGIFGDGPVGN